MAGSIQDLGLLERIDENNLSQGVILWNRFAVVGERRNYHGEVIVRVEDLNRSFAPDAPHRLDLHLLDLGVQDATIVERGFSLHHHAQKPVLATARTGRKLALMCKPTFGHAVEFGAQATGTDGVTTSLGSQRLPMQRAAKTVADLLENLHGNDVHGIRISHTQLRVDEGRYLLDGFSHLLGPPRRVEEDVDELIGLIRHLGGSELLGTKGERPRTASALVTILDRQPADLPSEFHPASEPPFVGRRTALSALESGMSQAKIAKPTTLVVCGERGIGKSRLLREFVATHIKADEFLVLTGAWQPQSGDTGSGLLGALEQLPKILPRLDPDERDDIRRRINRATRHLGAIVTRTAPAFGEVLRPAEELPQLEMGGDFSRHTAVIADVLKSIGTRQRPLLLVLDNLESIDANSAAVLEIVAQSTPAHYTLIVMGMRTSQRDVQYQRFNAEVIRLVPLELDEITELIERALPGEIEDTPAIAQELWTLSKGIPLTVSATLTSWLDEKQLISNPDTRTWRMREMRGRQEDALSLRSIYRTRLDNLSEAGRDLSLSLAVFGVEIKQEVVQTLSGGESGLVAELRERGLLVSSPAGVRFPHDTIREFVFEYFDDTARRKAHRQAAQLLTKAGASIPQIVYHRDYGFENSTETPEAFDKLSRLHVEAGNDRLAVYDLERARWHLERALEHSHDPEQRGLAAEGLADICLLQEDLDEAVSLYTAIIATAKPADAVRVAAKAVQFLYGKHANAEALQLGNMALEMAGEPTPSTPLGKLRVLFSSLARSWIGECSLDFELRDGLCRLYMYMAFIALIDDPISVPMYTFRGRWVAIGLNAGSAAISRSLEAALLTVMGWVKTAGKVFVISDEIAQGAKDAWAQGMVFHHWGGALLALDRYSDGQDRLDDGIAAFRETGDVSIALISMFYKSVYGRDREPAEVVLGWIDEALTTARRNGKRSGVATLNGLKLHILARQGRRDLDERLEQLATSLEGDEVPGIERLGAQIHLTYAYLEHERLDRAVALMRVAQAHAGELGDTVPEWCNEVHLVAALVLLALPMPSRADQKALKAAVRKFRRASKDAPRLQVLYDNLMLQMALRDGKLDKAHQLASKIVSDFDRHENLHIARQAHRALARFLKGNNVLAAVEHDGLARNMGRRLGLLDHVLLSDFSELGREVGMIALQEERESQFKLEESQHDVPAAALFSASDDRKPAPPKKATSRRTSLDDGADVLRAWELTETSTPRPSPSLGSLIDPVEQAVAGKIENERLELSCPTPERQVPFDSSDLQLLLINMLLAAPDAVGPRLTVSANIEVLNITDPKELERLRLKQPGEYLSIYVSASGPGTQTPIIGAFPTCENEVQALGGVLSATTAPGKMSLRADIYVRVREPVPVARPTEHVVVVHSDPTTVETLGAALDELGLAWTKLDPNLVSPSALEGARMVLAGPIPIETLQLLVPLTNARLVEIVRRGDNPVTNEFSVLRVPFAVSELEELLR